MQPRRGFRWGLPVAHVQHAVLQAGASRRRLDLGGAGTGGDHGVAGVGEGARYPGAYAAGSAGDEDSPAAHTACRCSAAQTVAACGIGSTAP